MSFPACRHAKRTSKHPVGAGLLPWLAAEPFRIFFFTGALWSVIGVMLWPMFFAGVIATYPLMSHPRLMIQCFAGAFVIGFLGTAGPRMASAPKLTPLELLGLLALHLGCGICHVQSLTVQGDQFFLATLVLLAGSLIVRVLRYRQEWPPPQILLALMGLICGMVGVGLHLFSTPPLPDDWHRLANLLLFQGLLLPPVLGIGAFLFPRILGGAFGVPTPAERRRKTLRAMAAALLLAGSFPLEAFGWVKLGGLLRVAVCVSYLILEVRWKKAPGDPARGSWTTGLHWALLLAFCGIATAPWLADQRVAVEHLLYIGGFGLLMLVVASRVLFGHSGDLDGFSKRSWTVRIFILLAILAATTRTSANFIPTILLSHYKYAAWTWGILGIWWLIWHRRRFIQRDPEE
jgi:uncharacterized protein involved in response to NO